ncbi:hypothetical protein J31TS4_15690 [Paenibacillus sp. J31TS4]|nr:hypothetical protein [Paenibacillus sp. J31TS4]GIP38289.1 hypothetical protein J31TS4_15690 [Paenibacillus sp. J31TS4]
MRVMLIERDAAGWSLVLLSGALGAYACWLFHERLSGAIAHGILGLFVS